MANKISSQATRAFYNDCNFHLSNTSVFDKAMFLWGNKILWKDEQDNICFCLCGWDTHTTCERLRAAGLPINHKKKQLYFGNIAISDCCKYRINHLNNTITQL